MADHPPRPTLATPTPTHHARATAAVDALVASLQAGWDACSAAHFDARLAADVVWGSPFGQLVCGWESLFAIHRGIMDGAREGGGLPASRYVVENVLVLEAGVVVAHVRRGVVGVEGEGEGEGEGGEGSGGVGAGAGAGAGAGQGAFSEMAMYVLVERGGEWWVAAGQNTVVGTPPQRR